MNILIANKFFHIKGGSERVLFQEREFLLGQGIKVVDFSMQDPLNMPSPCSGAFVAHIDYQNAHGLLNKLKDGVKFIHSWEAVHKLEVLVQEMRPDIAHLHNIYHQLTPSIIPVLKKHGIPVVLTVHDYKLICPSYMMLNGDEICTACGGRYFWKPLARHCQGSRMQELLLVLEAYWHTWKGSYELVDLFLAPSQFMADQVSRRVPREKIRVLHNGIDTHEIAPQYQDRGYALYFGRISHEKGVETLLKAHRTMPEAMPLKIVGVGPLESDLSRRYPDGEFLGYSHGKELNDIVAGAAFVVIPSECNENCSMAVLEAMAMGKPVIGSRVGGIPEQIQEGVTGLLFEMGNAEDLAGKMTALADNPAVRVSMGKAARERCEKEYSLSSHCQGLLEIYQQLV